MKICLISPNKPYLENPMSLPPMGMLYVARSLKNNGHEVICLDFSKKKRFVDADVYGISTTTPDFPYALNISKWLRKQGAKRIICGGPHATLCPEECLKFGFDAVGVGDGEISILDLLNGKRISKSFSTDIDSFYPDRNALNLHDYNFLIGKNLATPVMTARGCIWAKCIFCCRVQPNLRFHSIEHIKNEFEEIYNLNFSAIMIYDDEFFVYPKRDSVIIDLIKKYGFIWRAFGHSKFLLQNKELLKKASKSDLYEILIGIESGSKKILQTIQKGTTPEMNVEVIKFLDDLGIHIKAAIIVGLPGENMDTLLETWKFCEKVEDYITNWDFTICTPYPGSQIYDFHKLYDFNFNKNDIYKAYKGMGSKKWEICHISTQFLTFDEILSFREKLEKRFKK